MTSFSVNYGDPKPAPPNANCWICLENENESKIEPLLRNCACRGDAGWAHVSCLTELAARKDGDSREQAPRTSHWNSCPLCKSLYAEEMAVEMALAYVRRYEHLSDTSDFRWSSLQNLGDTLLARGSLDSALMLFRRLLELSKELETNHMYDVRRRKAHILGQLYSNLMLKCHPQEAFSCANQEIAIYTELFGPNSPEAQYRKRNMRFFQSMLYPGVRQKLGKDTAGQLETVRREYEEDRNFLKNEPVNLIGCADKLRVALIFDGKYQEALELLKRQAAESKQIFGLDHPRTIEYDTNLGMCKELYSRCKNHNVWAQLSYEHLPSYLGRLVPVIKAVANGKYIVFINSCTEWSMFKVQENHLIFPTHTKIVVRGLVAAAHLNGTTAMIQSFHATKGRYAIKFDKDNRVVMIKPANARVVFPK